MALLEILHFPDSRLRKVAKEVTRFDPELETFVSHMLETMYAAPGIGLAATQVNHHERIIVMDVSEDKNNPLVIINPVIVSKTGEGEMDEGCLSIPDQFEKIKRAESVTIQYQDKKGAKRELTTDGLLAVCIQHEMDHLEGKLFVDYLSKLKRNRIRKKLEKIKQQSAVATVL